MCHVCGGPELFSAIHDSSTIALLQRAPIRGAACKDHWTEKLDFKLLGKAIFDKDSKLLGKRALKESCTKLLNIRSGSSRFPGCQTSHAGRQRILSLLSDARCSQKYEPNFAARIAGTQPVKRLNGGQDIWRVQRHSPGLARIFDLRGLQNVIHPAWLTEKLGEVLGDL
jgi:hypothetical protein